MMNIGKHYSLVHADRIIAAVRRRLRPVKGKTMTQLVWANGREQGYAIRCDTTNRMVLFAQQRNGDSLFVVPGNRADFDIQTNHPNDKVWETRKNFDADKEAIEYITTYLLQGE